MKHISELANVSNFAAAKEIKDANAITDPVSAKIVDSIFVKMAVLCRDYGTLFDDERKENAEKVQWAMAFSKRKITRKSQIQAALDMLEEHKYFKPPQLGQFLEWCNMIPRHSQFMPVHQAFKLCCKMNVLYSDFVPEHVAINTVLRHVINEIGATKFRGMTEKVAYQQFDHFYTVACRQYLDGEIKPIPIAIAEKPEPHPIDKVKSNEARIKAMKAIRAIGIGAMT